MTAKQIHLAYAALLLVLLVTVFVHFPFSLYLFALIKSMIILTVFMKLNQTDEASKIYLIIAVATLAVMGLFVWDDLYFR